jgi:hypothetical protein
MLEAYKDRSIEVERFKQSNRPIPKSMLCSIMKKGNYLPVVRYEGLYYSKQQDSSYFGKFYFYEPESSYGINLGNYLLAANKYQAIRYFETKILGEFNEIELLRNGIVPNILSLYYLFMVANTKHIITDEELGDEIMVGNMSLENSSTKFKEVLESLLSINYAQKERILFQLSETKEELTTILYSEEDVAKYRIRTLVPVNYNILGEPQSIGRNSLTENYNGNLYGKSDYLDQPLVELARRFGVDTIILQREIGEYNIVTEVLDCREDTNNISKIPEDTTIYKYPLIWTDSKGLLSF